MQVDRLSLPRRLAGRFRAREAMDAEWLFTFLDTPRELGLEFFNDRALMGLQMQYDGSEAPVIEAVQARKDDTDWKELDYVVEHRGSGPVPTLSIHVQTVWKASHVRVMTRDDVLIPIQLTLTLRKDRCQDLQFLNTGMYWAGRGELSRAIRSFEEYSRMYSSRSPFVNFHLSLWHQQLGEIATARAYALGACAVGNVDVCRHAYIEAEKARTQPSVQQIRELQKTARNWTVDGSPGAVVLDTRRELDFEVAEAVHADCDYTLLEIRRASAARMLAQTGYAFDASKETVLYATCRIVHPDDSVEEVGDDRVTVHDAQDDSPLITLEQRKRFAWILPGITAGDLIETRFHRLRKGTKVNGKSWPGRIERICDRRFPTYKAMVEVRSPRDVELQVQTLNCDVPVRRLADSPQREAAYVRVDRHVPTRFTGIMHEASLLEPAVAIGPANGTWKELARSRADSLLGERPDDVVPPRLKQIIDANPDPVVALEKCFYVLRDDLKYASTLGAKTRIGVAGRADQILESGIGDCADKSFLLHLVCSELGLPHDLVLFDTESGQPCEEVPADTFDHVLLRVDVEGREMWLDASDRFGVFGSVPIALQGMRGLALDDEGTIMRVGEDAPESNRMVIRERLDHFEDHMLSGEIEIEAHGTTGRMLEEHVKALSLDAGGLGRGNSMALMFIFPELSLKSLEVHSHATRSRVFRASGRHARGRLSRLTGSGNSVGRLSWISPYLPFWEWPARDRTRKLWVGLPIVFRVELELGEEVRSALVDRSVVDDVENGLFSVTETASEEGGKLRLCREVVLRRGMVEAPLTELVPALTESVARASSLALHFDGPEPRQTRSPAASRSLRMGG